LKRWTASFLLFSLLSLGLSVIPAAASGIDSFGTSSLTKSDGSFWIWGDRRTVPTQIPGLQQIKNDFADTGFVVEEDGSVYYISQQFYSLEYEIHPVEAIQHVEKVYYGYGRYLFLDRDGNVFATHRKDGSIAELLEQIQPVPGMQHVKDISGYVESREAPYAYDPMWLFLKDDGTVWKGKENADTWDRIAVLDGALDLEQNLVLKTDGTVWAFPKYLSGDEAAEPAPVEGLSGITSIHTNGRSSVAVDEDGRLWFWGASVTGASDGTLFHDHPIPIRFENVDHLLTAYVVDRSLIAHTDDGSVFASSIGTDTVDRSQDFRLLATGVRRLEAAWGHMIIQKEDGTLWSWGDNDRAQLGTGNYEPAFDSPVPMQKPVSLRLNGETVALANGIVIQGGQAFVPLRSVFEKLGAVLSWDHPTQTVTIQRNGTTKPELTVVINYASGEVKVNETPVVLANRPFIVNGSSYLPLRFVSESLGAKVEWKSSEEIIDIVME